MKTNAVLFRGLPLVAVLVGSNVEAKAARSQTTPPSNQEAPLSFAAVDVSNGIDAREAEAIAETYFQRYMSDCGGPDRVARHGRTWVVNLLFGVTATKIRDTIRIDAKTGAVSSDDGPRFRDLASFRDDQPEPETRTNLVINGTVSSITQAGSGLKPWIVTIDVTKVVSGDFSDDSFSFAVHSPAKSGLEVGRAYTVKARWQGTGYEVDGVRWRRPK